MQVYTQLNSELLSRFKYIVSGAFFQMQADCIARIREISQLVSGEVIYIDVFPAANQQVILSNNERQLLLKQLGVSHYASIPENQWSPLITMIRGTIKCGQGIYKGPFMLSGLTENGIDYTRIKTFLSDFFMPDKLITWHEKLGYFFPLTGEVVYGNKIGRTLGYPTINIQPFDLQKLIPPMGVYTAMVKHGSEWFKAMVNIGIRPTLDLSQVTIEAHIFNFEKEIYGESVSIHFLARIRDEMKFASLDSLKTQLNKDKKKATDQLKAFLPVPGIDVDLVLK